MWILQIIVAPKKYKMPFETLCPQEKMTIWVKLFIIFPPGDIVLIMECLCVFEGGSHGFEGMFYQAKESSKLKMSSK